jgi:hypothetical protein
MYPQNKQYWAHQGRPPVFFVIREKTLARELQDQEQEPMSSKERGRSGGAPQEEGDQGVADRQRCSGPVRPAGRVRTPLMLAAATGEAASESNKEFARQLVRSRLHNLESLEHKVARISTASYDLIAACDDLMSTIREEQSTAEELRCRTGDADGDYIYTFTFMIEKICSALMPK